MRQAMKIVKTVLKSLLLLAVLYSCKSNEELIYLQNLPEGEKVDSAPFNIDSYALRAGDNLYVQVASIDPEVNQLFNPSMGSGMSGGTSQQYGSLSASYLNGYLISQEGTIDLPIIGEVAVVGKTLGEVKKLLSQRAAEYLKNATITVKMLNFKVTVMGEVARPGVYYSYNNSYTLLEAISSAGGTTDYSRLRKAMVVRETQDGTMSIKVDLTDKALLSSTAYYLQPNDVIYVWPDRYKNTRLNATLYSLALTSISTLVLVLNYMN